MMNSLFSGLNEALARQSLVFCGEEVCLSDYGDSLRQAQERYLYCLRKKRIKHYPSKILLHADEYCSFLVFLARQAYLQGSESLAEIAYLLNRRLHAFECFYTRMMPDVFHLEHPVGSVMGQAIFGEYLVVYQGVSVGGDLKLRYPIIGEGVALFSKSSLIGAAVVEDNCAIGAGVQLYGARISANMAVSYRCQSGFASSSMTWSVKERFFM
jgi:serine O-acetyltransferase